MWEVTKEKFVDRDSNSNFFFGHFSYNLKEKWGKIQSKKCTFTLTLTLYTNVCVNVSVNVFTLTLTLTLYTRRKIGPSLFDWKSKWRGCIAKTSWSFWSFLGPIQIWGKSWGKAEEKLRKSWGNVKKSWGKVEEKI